MFPIRHRSNAAFVKKDSQWLCSELPMLLAYSIYKCSDRSIIIVRMSIANEEIVFIVAVFKRHNQESSMVDLTGKLSSKSGPPMIPEKNDNR